MKNKLEIPKSELKQLEKALLASEKYQDEMGFEASENDEVEVFQFN